MTRRVHPPDPLDPRRSSRAIGWQVTGVSAVLVLVGAALAVGYLFWQTRPAEEAGGDPGSVRVFVEPANLVIAGLIVGAGAVLCAGGAAWLIARRAVRPLAEAARIQERFVADASHELRTPLATIRAYAQLSDRADAGEPEIRGNAALIDVEGVRMGALIDQLLVLARLDALPALAQDEVDLRLLLAEAVLAARLAGPDHVWILELGEDAALVRGDAGDLRRVVDNLLGNARVHTPERTTVRVRLDEVRTGEGVAPEPAEGSVRLTVSDDGPGLPEAVRDTVFERFARGETSRSREGGGTGLGMAIARAVVEAHGGTITLGPGPGTTFVVMLPIAGPDTDPDASRRITLEG